ncbi:MULTISPECIES: TadE family protein [Vibrio]|uniref:TadE family protein n=1 Tax=Vibrio TaxID=662 RepID=UPI0001B953D6|nr:MULTISPECIES: TadE family protein [Vibrio]EEX34231.1 flp pilus assembly membrane protein TadE [Vibrio coralliilyticus ATCC BAA-450]MDE3898638.1 pilus assembly protein [Vibrio sp. CC007]
MRVSLHRIRGVASVEFALGFMLFWAICMGWVEMSYMSFVSAVCDVVLSESVRESKVQAEDYRQVFTQALSEASSVWGSLVDPSQFKLSIQYLDSVGELEQLEKPCLVPDGEVVFECGNETMQAIAVYRIDYDFYSFSSYFLDTSNIFSREAIVIQEYERDAFEI